MSKYNVIGYSCRGGKVVEKILVEGTWRDAEFVMNKLSKKGLYPEIKNAK